MVEAEHTVSSSQRRFDEFFNEGIDRHARAAAVAGNRRRRYRIAGMSVEFRFAGLSLVEAFTAALSHLEIDSWSEWSEADFAFNIYDEASTGLGPPRVRWDPAEQFAQGEVRSLIDADRYLHVEQPRRRVTAGHRPSRSALVWLASAEEVAAWERAAPFFTLINWWASGAGYVRIHAGAVGRPEGGVLIVGPGGTGKSHTAVSCLESDLLYAADDHCLLGTSGASSVASIYSTAKLFHADLHRFPILVRREPHAVRTPEGKAIFFLDDFLPERLSSGFALKAVLLPTPSGRSETTILPGRPFAALLHLGSESALRSPSVGRTSFARVAASLRRLPCYRIETGTDMRQIPRVITHLLDELSEANAATPGTVAGNR
jgi:hypothetical protein